LRGARPGGGGLAREGAAVSLWFAALLGLVQGLTEFLPVSSTAHLRIVPEIVGRADPGAAFTAVIQLGTLVAVLAYFARELFVDLPRGLLRDRRGPEARLVGHLVIGTLPIVVAGLALEEFITGDARSLYVIAAALVGVGVLFLVAERGGRGGAGARALSAMTAVDALLIGLAQACALVPGVSRSGATIVAALLVGLGRADGARFSFLLGVPAIAGAGLFELPDAIAGLGADAVPALVIATTVSAVSGYLAIAWFLRYLGRNRLAPFALYRIALGLALAGLCLGGVLSARSG
jgi:undecaprenyl-diphosphatase